jgi:uroporphyrinogen-III synthase
MGGGEEVVVVRVREGPCPLGARCVSIGAVRPRRDIQIPDGDYLVVMSPAVASAVDVAAVAGRFKCVICVGPATAAAVGGGCVVPREYTSYGVAQLLKALAPGKTVVLRSSAGNDVLRSLVPDVIEVPVYDVVFEEEKIREAVSAVSAAKAVVLTSSAIAEIMASHVDLTGKIVVAIGAVTSKKLRELGVSHVVAEEATIESAVKTALRNWEKNVG